MEIKTLKTVLDRIQQNISGKWPSSLKENPDKPLLCSYISSEIKETDLDELRVTKEELVERIYCEMAAYSFLTEYLNSSNVDEININSWDDISISYSDGTIQKTEEHFFDPEHALDIIRRLLRHSGMVIDSSSPIASGHLDNSSRITAIKTPVVTEEAGVSASIRILHPNKITPDTLVKSGFCSGEMLAFLCACLNKGISILASGRTNSGKTTLISAILSSVPSHKRIYVIESGARELELVKRDEKGKIKNNVVSTLSRPSDDPKRTITQEDLVESSLRFDPDIIAIGEIRNAEAFSSVEASLTGHTVISTVHSGPGESAHSRIALLCQRKYRLGYELSLSQVRAAFPIIVFSHRCEDGTRRIMNITECVKNGNEFSYVPLYSFVNGSTGGSFVKSNPMSKDLISRLRAN